MYAVIFKAEINELDESYSTMAEKLQKLAMEKYGCTEFTAVAEGKQEITISCWDNLHQIKRWKQDALHLSAQENGRNKWYKSYRVYVTEIKHETTYDSKKENIL